jgi:FkbM family methyltransferase
LHLSKLANLSKVTHAHWLFNPGIVRSLLTYYAIPGRLRRLRRFYAQFIQQGDLCFDIGAHVGNRFIPWRRLGASVIAVEPQPALYRFLQGVYGRSPNITLVDKAIGATTGSATLHISSRFPTVTTLSQKWITAVQDDTSFAKVAWDKSIDVAVITLDDLIATYGQPAFCKIDIEGFELEALQGLSTPIKALSFEYIPATAPLTIACIQRLMGLGNYRFNWASGETYQFIEPEWLPAERMIQALQQIKLGQKSGDIYAKLF